MISLPRLAGFSAATLLAGGSLCAILAQTPLPIDSPFAPVGTPAGMAAAHEDFQLTGATVTDTGTEVCIYNAQTKHSHWVAIGASQDGVQVLSFDPMRDEASVRVNGIPKTLQLRKAVVKTSVVVSAPQNIAAVIHPDGGPNAASAAPEPVNTKPAEELKQEREARMMVSDLLDIGMKQRQAYEEAQKKAAAQGHSN